MRIAPPKRFLGEAEGFQQAHSIIQVAGSARKRTVLDCRELQIKQRFEIGNVQGDMRKAAFSELPSQSHGVGKVFRVIRCGVVVEPPWIKAVFCADPLYCLHDA